jgi:hypothetical protein
MLRRCAKEAREVDHAPANFMRVRGFLRGESRVLQAAWKICTRNAGAMVGRVGFEPTTRGL